MLPEKQKNLTKEDNSKVKWVSIVVGIVLLYFVFSSGTPKLNLFNSKTFNIDDYGTSVSDLELNRFEDGYISGENQDFDELENAIASELGGATNNSTSKPKLTDREKGYNEFSKSLERLNNTKSIKGQWSYVVTKSDNNITTFVSEFTGKKNGVVWEFVGKEKERQYPDSGAEVFRKDLEKLLSLLPEIPTYDAKGNVVKKSSKRNNRDEKEEWQLPVSMKTYHPVISLTEGNFQSQYIDSVSSNHMGVGSNYGMEGFLSKKFKGYKLNCIETSYKANGNKLEEYSIYELTKWGRTILVETSILLSY